MPTRAIADTAKMLAQPKHALQRAQKSIDSMHQTIRVSQAVLHTTSTAWLPEEAARKNSPTATESNLLKA
jgi:hypothetical protein